MLRAEKFTYGCHVEGVWGYFDGSSKSGAGKLLILLLSKNQPQGLIYQSVTKANTEVFLSRKEVRALI
jgi:hypothetical protein